MNYFVVFQDYGENGLEAVVDPGLDRQQIIDRIKTREFDNIVRIDRIEDGLVTDVTTELIDAAEKEIADDQRSETDALLSRLPESQVRPVR